MKRMKIRLCCRPDTVKQNGESSPSINSEIGAMCESEIGETSEQFDHAFGEGASCVTVKNWNKETILIQMGFGESRSVKWSAAARK